MPDIKQILNEEIRRLARKELKSFLLPFAKQVSEQKKVIAELKKQVAELNKRIPPVEEKAPLSAEIDPEEAKKLRLTAAGIVKIRKKLGISQNKLAALLGVSGHAVSLWEVGKVAPRSSTKAAICALRTMGKREIKRRLAEIGEVVEAGEAETQNNQ